MNQGQIGILSVGAGDTKISFDKSNKAECIRAGRIVTDMLRRGYALLIEVPDGKGGTTHTRVKAFDETTSEYLIADFDPVVAQAADEHERKGATDDAQQPEEAEPAAEASEPGPATGGGQAKRRGRPPLIRVPAGTTRGVAVARSAGG